MSGIRGSSRKGALTSTFLSGIVFRALAGTSGKSPGALAEESCCRMIVVMISLGGVSGCMEGSLSETRSPKLP